MRKFKIFLAALCVLGLMSVSSAPAAPQAANFAGTWQMMMTGGGPRGGQGGGGQDGGGGQGGGGGEGRGGGRGRGQRGGSQTLVITQNGDKVKVDHKTPRDDQTYDAAVSGSTISWTEERQGRNGDTMKIDFKATIDGDTLNGTMGGGQFSRNFTAKRSN
jgi:hypothetical protein